MAGAIIPVGPAPDGWSNEGASDACVTLSSAVAWTVEYRWASASLGLIPSHTFLYELT
jgi:hypothetical protein